MIKKYFRIWLITTFRISQIVLVSRFGAIVFIIGKFLRFAFFLLFLIILEKQTKSIAGYSLWQVILFFATFNLIDTLAQFLLREVYRFRSYVVSGDFDYILTKPVSPLFRSLLGGSDILDIPMILFSLVFLVVSMLKIGDINFVNYFIYAVLVVNALIIAFAFHIITLAIGILTTEVDNTIMLYRDLTQMGRVPVDIYREPLSFIITFLLPVGIMMSFPAKSLLNFLDWQLIFLSVAVGLIALFVSIKLWNFALKNYTSASS